MADFCLQCSMEEFGQEDNGLVGLTKPEDTAAGKYANGLCEGCSPNLVDHTGKCVSSDCLRQHGTIAWDDAIVAFW